jgi:hypothetical protein
MPQLSIEHFSAIFAYKTGRGEAFLAADFANA